MPIFGEHRCTSITIKINQLAEPNRNDEVDDSIELYLSDLLDLIQIQPSGGASEAARAIRKKIKYGESINEQMRALKILELLILNSGPKIGPVIARDDKLLDVLKGVITGNGKTGSGVPYDPKVQKVVRQMALGWKGELADMEGYKYMQSLYKWVPRNKGHRRDQSRGDYSEHNDSEQNDENQPHAFDDSYQENLRSPERSSPRSPPPPRPRTPTRSRLNKNPSSGTSGDKSKKKKKKKKSGTKYADEEFEIPQINYKVEAPKIRELIASCYTHSTTLSNQLLQLPSGTSPLDDDKILSEFQKCKKIRRKVLNYLQFVGAGQASAKSSEVAALDEEFLGSLISANEQLVEVFQKFNFKAGYTQANPAPNYDEESDSGESYYTESDEEEEEEEEEEIEQRLNDVRIGKKSPPPPRPHKPMALNQAFTKNSAKNSDTQSIEGDPFGDTNALAGNRSFYD